MIEKSKQEEKEGKRLRKYYLREERRRRQLIFLQVIKLVPFLILIFGLTIYQTDWFGELEQFEIKFSFPDGRDGSVVPFNSSINSFNSNPKDLFLIHDTRKNINQIPMNITDENITLPPIYPYIDPNENISSNLDNSLGTNLTEFVGTVIQYVETMPINQSLNLTAAAESVLENQTYVEEVISYLNSTDLNLSLLLNALWNYSVPLDLVIAFFTQLWNQAINEFMPDSLKRPAQLIITNHGKKTFKGISFFSELKWGTINKIELVNYSNQILLPEKPLLIEIYIDQIIKNILQIAFESLINITITHFLDGPNAILESFQSYFHYLLVEEQLSIFFQMSLKVGLLPFNIDIAVDLQDIAKKIEEVLYQL